MAKAATADEIRKMAGQLAEGADVTYEQADSVFLAYKDYGGREEPKPKMKNALSLWFGAVSSELKAGRRSGVFAHTLPLTLFEGDEFFDVVSECLKSLPVEERVSYVVGEAGFVKAVSKEAEKVMSAAGCGVGNLVEKEDACASYGPAVRALGFLRARTLKRLETLRGYERAGGEDSLLCGFDLWCEVAKEEDPSVVNRIIQRRNFRDENAVHTCTAVIEYLYRKGTPVLLACCRNLDGDESWDILLVPRPVIPELPEIVACEPFSEVKYYIFAGCGRIEDGAPERHKSRRSKGAACESKEVSKLDAMVSAVHRYVKIEKDKKELSEDISILCRE